MELKDFTKLITQNDYYVFVDIFEALVDKRRSDEHYGEAIAKLYYSFPKELKSDIEQKKRLLGRVIQYFYSYYLTKENEEMFNDFFELMPNKDKDRIKERNKGWNWDKSITFKTITEFAKSIPPLRGGPIDFILKYEDQFDVFNKKSIKVLETFKRYGVWKEMIRTDYLKFSEFCEKKKFNRLEIIESFILDQNIQLAHCGVFEDKNIKSFMPDLEKIGKEKILSSDTYKNFIPKNGLLGWNNNENIISALKTIIEYDHYESSIKYIEFFKEELDDFAQKLTFSSKFNSGAEIKKVLEVIAENSGYSWSYKKVLEKEDWYKFFDSHMMMKNLNKELESNEIKNKKIKV